MLQRFSLDAAELDNPRVTTIEHEHEFRGLSQPQRELRPGPPATVRPAPPRRATVKPAEQTGPPRCAP
eukprot:4994683-Lingulodinium_polyedra.AAC.1